MTFPVLNDGEKDPVIEFADVGKDVPYKVFQISIVHVGLVPSDIIDQPVIVQLYGETKYLVNPVDKKPPCPSHAIIMGDVNPLPPPPPFNAYEAVNAVNAYDAVCEKDAETAVEDDIANDAVPCKLPVTPCVTVKEPVIVPLPSERKPRFILNSFAISVHYPRLVICYKYVVLHIST